MSNQQHCANTVINLRPLKNPQKDHSIINQQPNYLTMSLLAAVTLLGSASSVFAAAPSLGTAVDFTVLGGTNVTCTTGVVTGHIGVSPGSAVPYTNTGCTVTGSTPPATDSPASMARMDFLDAYTAIQLESSACTYMLGTTLAGENLAPGVYCLDAVAKTGTLTLNGPADGEWIFLVDGALTATNFTVVMAGGGHPCNVYWAPSAAATLTTSLFTGNILAGDATGGSINMTGGTFAGRALANVAITMTSVGTIGCGSLAPSTFPDTTPPGTSTCSDDDDDDDDHGDKHDKDHKHEHNKH